MIRNQEIDRWIKDEFQQMLSVLVWRNQDGNHEAFGRYLIIAQNPGYRVYINDDEQGFFNSTRTALSWCIADNHKRYNLARELLTIDNMLADITNDIFVRAGIASRSKDVQQRENIETKLETKILHKRDLESQLNKCVNWAKYLQQKGFENETSRFGTATTIKTNR